MSRMKPRPADPLWVECCRLWDLLIQEERAVIIKSMRLIIQGKVFIQNRNNESPDTDADTPEEC